MEPWAAGHSTLCNGLIPESAATQRLLRLSIDAALLNSIAKMAYWAANKELTESARLPAQQIDNLPALHIKRAKPMYLEHAEMRGQSHMDDSSFHI
jgi:hypothetical protein